MYNNFFKYKHANNTDILENKFVMFNAVQTSTLQTQISCQLVQCVDEFQGF